MRSPAIDGIEGTIPEELRGLVKELFNGKADDYWGCDDLTACVDCPVRTLYWGESCVYAKYSDIIFRAYILGIKTKCKDSIDMEFIRREMSFMRGDIASMKAALSQPQYLAVMRPAALSPQFQPRDYCCETGM